MRVDLANLRKCRLREARPIQPHSPEVITERTAGTTDFVCDYLSQGAMLALVNSLPRAVEDHVIDNHGRDSVDPSDATQTTERTRVEWKCVSR